MDVEKLIEISESLNLAGDIVGVASRIYESSVRVLETTGFVGLVGGTLHENHIQVLQPSFQELASSLQGSSWYIDIELEQIVGSSGNNGVDIESSSKDSTEKYNQPSGSSIFDLETNDDNCIDTQFTAFFDKNTSAEHTSNFLVYIHLHDAVEQITTDAQVFFEEEAKSKSAKDSSCIEIDTPITITLECEDQEFEPLAITKRWKPDWVRFKFDFVPSSDLIEDTIIVRVSIRAYGIEIASIEKCAIDIIEQVRSEPVINSIQADDNPLIKAKFEREHIQSQTTQMYKKIFVSYSREDVDIVESYRLAQLAIGNDVFVDTYSIRSGEDWQFSLANAIDTADVFQLFWSEKSSQSEYVGYEIDYALKVRCADDECYSFLRPVYWQTPMPNPPNGLSNHHFAYVPFEK